MFSSQVSPRFLPHSPFQMPNTYFKKNLENIAGELGVSWLPLCSEPREQESQGNRGGPRAPASYNSQEKHASFGHSGFSRLNSAEPKAMSTASGPWWQFYLECLPVFISC